MDIYLEDFEPTYCARLQQTRGLPDGVLAGESRYLFLGALFGTVPGMIVDGVIPNTPFDLSLVVAAGGVALGCACGFFVGRKNRSKQRTRRVMAQEIALVSKAETDPLGTEYLSLISELVLMRSFQDISVEQSIRNAIRDIGFGIIKLPGQPADDLLLDAESFKEEASRLATEAAQESDPVVAASFQRQADARNQRAEAISWNSALARRNQILRHEMTEQIKALKTTVSATALEDGGDGYDLAALAANIQQVATEARSLTEAKKELAYALEEGQGGRKNVIPEQPQLHGLSRQ